MYSPIQDIRGKVIFLTPLDWGLGHASRCVPIIETLSAQNTVVLGLSDTLCGYYESHFPHIQKIKWPSYGIRYSKRLPLFITLLLQFPKALCVAKKEHALLKEVIRQYQVNIVISDSRFGCYSKIIPSVLITHQLHIKVPVFSFLANTVNRFFVNRFSEVWVPDYKQLNLRLAGQLADASNLNIPVKYVGPQSALQKFANAPSEKKHLVLILLSGVEPQRSLLEQKLLKAMKNSEKNVVLVRGSEKPLANLPKGVVVYNYSYAEDLATLISQAEHVVCRSGYSTLMDLHVLQKTNITLIPTPGQSEQMYLAKHWQKHFGAKLCLQKDAEELKV
ncbi:MAG: hypothetical protein MUF75_06070 [Bacteroidia bacterium]|nr:hypothetical protein [Bacteroidia bacterium]